MRRCTVGADAPTQVLLLPTILTESVTVVPSVTRTGNCGLRAIRTVVVLLDACRDCEAELVSEEPLPVSKALVPDLNEHLRSEMQHNRQALSTLDHRLERNPLSPVFDLELSVRKCSHSISRSSAKGRAST